MINKNIKYLIVLVFVFVAASCSSTPEKPRPFWLQTADGFVAKGILFYERQQYEKSIDEFTNALNTYQRFDYVEGLANSYLNLAKSEIAQNNIPRARAYLDDLKIIIDENAFSSMSLRLDIMQASIAINTDKASDAISIMGKYIGESGENKLSADAGVYMALLTNRVRAAFKINRDSNKWLGIYAAKVNNSPARQARLLRFKGEFAGLESNEVMINQSFSSALDLYREQANPKAVLLTLKEWGDALMMNNKLADAAKRFEAVYKVALSSENKVEMNYALVSLLRIYKDLGDNVNHQRVNQIIAR